MRNMAGIRLRCETSECEGAYIDRLIVSSVEILKKQISRQRAIHCPIELVVAYVQLTSESRLSSHSAFQVPLAASTGAQYLIPRIIGSIHHFNTVINCYCSLVIMYQHSKSDRDAANSDTTLYTKFESGNMIGYNRFYLQRCRWNS